CVREEGTGYSNGLDSW
nr:immunoglobulin heavy chain junction region [Macaca mulatta]MPN71134.1 immunoglobulin heavy chain junction region [Macaca mulatta]MPN71514.1 immunoglobulin heavy chain junction region [Macaca mulatta]MPN72379.1 immunoglobulin heavy chain junction region [Macaca mulatta]MPN73640.1 immunoglobulin heavy chain junction region [Macaca mulatta]